MSSTNDLQTTILDKIKTQNSRYNHLNTKFPPYWSPSCYSDSPIINLMMSLHSLTSKKHIIDTNNRPLALTEQGLWALQYQIFAILVAILLYDSPVLNLMMSLDFLTSKTIKLTPVFGLQLSQNQSYGHSNVKFPPYWPLSCFLIAQC